MVSNSRRLRPVRRHRTRHPDPNWRLVSVGLLLFSLAIFLAWPARAASQTSSANVTVETPRGMALPEASGRQLALYHEAAQRYGLNPVLLLALHEVESNAAVGGCLANWQGSGAIGPFQFMPATFSAYAIDADGDGRVDPCSLADSLFAAAAYLHALGADGEPASSATYQALTRYGTDPDAVLGRVRAMAAPQG